MWIRNKRTGEYKNMSPAEAKYKMHHDTTKSWQDTQSQYCTCGAVNNREETYCNSCGKILKQSIKP